ncbi:MAG: hypothetical protein Q8K30_05440 [Candidatus Gracilibacteria bacterium]|nr:hypothetical protein [Candidatus Gracilibacteria bacterium]
MLTKLEIEELKNDGLSFEEIESIKQGLQDIEEGNVYSEEEFNELIKSDINAYLLNREKCIV